MYLIVKKKIDQMPLLEGFFNLSLQAINSSTKSTYFSS